MSLIEVHQFSYTYPGGNRPALDGVDLSIERGDLIVITGKSGCGKSTMGKALAGYLFQDEDINHEGQIIVNETDMSVIPLYAASEKVAYVQQNPEDQFCTLTVQDEIAFGLENRMVAPIEIKTRTIDALSIVGGEELIDRDLATLSGGEKQKVAIASMLALSPDVLILDEPTSNLDPIATNHIFKTLYRLREDSGLTIIIIEHKLSQLLPLNPKLLVLEDGKTKGFEPVRTFLAKQQATLAEFPKPGAIPLNQRPEPTFELDQVELSLGTIHILDDINFALYPGDFISLMGPNGSGKTSLLLTMMGLYHPTRGTIRGFRRNLTEEKTSNLVPNIGFIFQNPDHQLFTSSVWDEATFTLKNLGLLTEEKQAEARDALAQLGMDNDLDRHPQSLSYGEKRRLNLISAILHEPKLLLIDELLIGQDPENANFWMSLLWDYARRGNTIVLVNHHAKLTENYCNRLIFINAGRVQVDSPTSEAFAELASLGFSDFLPISIKGSDYA
jgi:energy-coupling factor transport system ATP-binding protein